MRTWIGALAIGLAACGNVKDTIDARPVIDSVTECPVGVTSMCASDDLVTCDGQGVVTGQTTCSLGCGSTATPHCKRVEPSNGLVAALDEAETAIDVVFVGDATINTDSGTVMDQSGTRVLATETLIAGLPIPVFVIKAHSVSATSITVTGTRALAIISFGPVQISGSVSLSAVDDVSGPGAITNVATCQGGTATSNAEGKPGGGGGGFGTMGGAGGSGGSPLLAGANGGALAGTAELVPLRGGCPGGNAGGEGPSAVGMPDPGGAGGAIQVFSTTSITLAASADISANGGAGQASPVFVSCGTGSPCGFGEGGGAGGGILLEAPVIEIPVTAGVYANGGGGACDVRGAGQAGQKSDVPASGQVCTQATNGSGGNGAAASTPPTNGVNRTGLDSIGGGGGGGAGRIRVNLPTGATFTPGGKLSPTPSVGALIVQ